MSKVIKVYEIYDGNFCYTVSRFSDIILAIEETETDCEITIKCLEMEENDYLNLPKIDF